jgi:hypothetical protein
MLEALPSHCFVGWASGCKLVVAANRASDLNLATLSLNREWAGFVQSCCLLVLASES